MLFMRGRVRIETKGDCLASLLDLFIHYSADIVLHNKEEGHPSRTWE